MKIADQIILHLLKYGRKNPSEIMLANIQMFMYEMDVFKLMSNGYVVEYEVKISRSDFFNDFKKNHGRYNQPPVYKHQDLADGKAANRFFFVTTKGLVTKEEVPYYAGLMYFDDGKICTIKPAPLIHRKPFDDYRSLAISLSWREEHLRRRYNNMRIELQSEIKLLKNEKRF